jgi:hypothetical protein
MCGPLGEFYNMNRKEAEEGRRGKVTGKKMDVKVQRRQALMPENRP